MAKIVALALRGFEFFMALLIMALIGNAIAMGADSSINNYTMFCAAFGMLTLFFLIPASLKEEWSVFPFLPFTLDLLNNIFWFCAAVALAAELGVHSCDNSDYTHSNRVIRGAGSSGACRESQASCAFLWFGWAAFVGTTVLTGLQMTGGSSSARPGVRRSGPAMSQV